MGRPWHGNGKFENTKKALAVQFQMGTWEESLYEKEERPWENCTFKKW
jgi:hypothetical protein